MDNHFSRTKEIAWVPPNQRRANTHIEYTWAREREIDKEKKKMSTR